MPSTITHAFIGLDTINKLNNKPKKIINNRVDNFKVYCQNMDVLYFYHIYLLVGNKVDKLGHQFHRDKVFDSFKLLIEDNKKNKDLELFTFIAGLITHYQADTIIHPYVNSFSNINNKTKVFDKHFEVETYLDSYFVKKRLTDNYKKYNVTKFIFSYSKEDIIKKELDKLFKELFNYPNMGKKYYRALAEMKFTYNYVRYDKYGIKKQLYKIIDLNPFNLPKTKYLSYHFDLDNDEYYLNLSNKKWMNNNMPSTKSLLDLYDEVINKASYIINELYEYIFENKKVNLKELIKNLNYGTGLEISPSK